MTKIGSPTGGIRPPDFETNKPTAANPKIEAPVQKTSSDQPVNPGSATEAKGILNSQAELMKKKLQEGLKSPTNIGTAPGDKVSPGPHGSHPAPAHPPVIIDIKTDIQNTVNARERLVSDPRLEDEKKK